ncbi:uncharacterized protein TNCV_1523371 [Trichonephila clavipes]|nr:uncharacterized protein TNCV_1523371 [Trichonephila clavipes]
MVTFEQKAFCIRSHCATSKYGGHVSSHLELSKSSQGPHDKACFAWPPRLPDLRSCHIYLWGFIKDCVYVSPLPADLPDLRHRIEVARLARITSDTLNRVWDALANRLDV